MPKEILLPVRDKAVAHVALDTALSVAERFNSHIEGLFIRNDPPILAGAGLGFPGDLPTLV